MENAFKDDLTALLKILHQNEEISYGYTVDDIAGAETAFDIHFPTAMKTVYETVGKDSILADGFYAPSEIRILHEPRTYNRKPCGEYTGFEFADHNGERYAYYPFRRRDCDYKCYEKIEKVSDKPHEFFTHISDERRKMPDYSGFLHYFADIMMSQMKYIITFTGKKALNDYVSVCQGFGAKEFHTYLPYTSYGEEIRHLMYCSDKGLLIVFDDDCIPKLQIGTNSASAVEEISRVVKIKLIRDNGKKVIDPKYYFTDSLPDGFCERMELLYSLYFGKTASGAALPNESFSSLPDSLAFFYRIMGKKASFLDSSYRIVPCEMLDTGKDCTVFAVEEQGVCEYQIDLKNSEVYYKSDDVFEKVPMSLEDFLLYMSVLQGLGVMHQQAFISGKEDFSRFFGKMTLGGKNVYINPKRKVIAFEYGDRILAMARSTDALQKLEEQCGLELEYL